MSVPQLQELLLKLSLDAAKLGFGVSPLLRALALDIHHLCLLYTSDAADDSLV